MATRKRETVERQPVDITDYARKRSSRARAAETRAAHASIAAPYLKQAELPLPMPTLITSNASIAASAAALTPLPLSFAQASSALRRSIPASEPVERVVHRAPDVAPTRVKKAGVRERFGELRALLADGFEIVQPIFARPLWSATDDSTTAFNFVLRRERATKLVTVPEGRTVQRFIRERQLLVDYRR